jgi:acetyltransferase-like isoleucine patch superfamily enzyme
MFLGYRLVNFLRCLIFRFAVGRFFGRFGRRAALLSPVGIEGIKNIYIGDDVYISTGALLAAVPHTGAAGCRLTIGKGSSLGRHNHIYATAHVEFGENVLTANNVYVADNTHAYRDIALPIRHQGVLQLRPVWIGDGSWLGQNVCVLGASIGKGCVIGANSVVTSDIPDYSLAVGAPARVIRRHDPATGEWLAVEKSRGQDNDSRVRSD